MSGTPDIALFVGRLHPLMVHLPIGLIVLLALLEGLACTRRFKQVNANAGLILAMAAPLAIFTVVCGWLLSEGGGYETRLLQWHKWTGLGTAAGCLVAALFYALNRRKLYRGCLFLTTGALAVAGHYGGSLTHGSDYLARYAPGPLKSLLGSTAPISPSPAKPGDLSATSAFAGVVQPMLQKDCVSCHGPDKVKGGLRMDSLTALMKGGKSGLALVPGKASESELVRRVELPLTDDDHMPPAGKPQPSAEDLALLQWWVDAGAPADKKLGELKAPAAVARILAARLSGATPLRAKVVAPEPLHTILPVAMNLAEELGIPLGALAPKEPWLQCNASVAGTNFGDEALAKLAPLGRNLRRLDLGGTGVSDEGLAQVAAMPNLVRLHLERTAVTDQGLEHLAGLANLEYLNLYGTAVTDAGLDTLAKLPKLKQLYLWQTKVTPDAGKAFVAARTDEAQLQKWRDEIEQLRTQIREARVSVEFGTALAAAAGTNATPINTICPISGKPIDPTKTVLYQGSLVALCCDDCKAKFQKDAKPYLARLGLSATNAPGATGGEH